MNDVVLGRVLRALRRRRGWRQVDLAERSGTSQSHISAIERGSARASSLGTVRRVFEVLEARAEVVVSWRGADLDRLLDEDHRELVGQVARRLEAVTRGDGRSARIARDYALAPRSASHSS